MSGLYRLALREARVAAEIIDTAAVNFLEAAIVLASRSGA